MSAGYSGTPLARKLGIKPGMRVLTLGAPAGFPDLLEPLPDGVTLLTRSQKPADVIIAFADTPAILRRRLDAAIAKLPADGGLWVAWPKKSAVPDTRLSFDVVQTRGLSLGLVDNKICAIDDTWSGLRLVVRREDRAAWPR
ncbi:MAG: DUF3052 domain-containing protein [Pseudomonadota bacterium]